MDWRCCNSYHYPAQCNRQGLGKLRLRVLLRTLRAGFSSTIVAWCLDILHDLTQPGSYTTGGPLSGSPPSGSDWSKIGGLMLQGNNFLAQAGSTVNVYGTSYSKTDVSAATQVAIWAEEYGTGFTFSSIDSGLGFRVQRIGDNSRATRRIQYCVWHALSDGSGSQSEVRLSPHSGPCCWCGTSGTDIGASRECLPGGDGRGLRANLLSRTPDPSGQSSIHDKRPRQRGLFFFLRCRAETFQKSAKRGQRGH